MTNQAYLAENRDRFLDELFTLLRIPSVSTAKEHDDDTHYCATMVQQYLVKAGLDQVSLYPTDGHPIVYAEKMIDPSLPTILVYGHYDVQPAAPLDQWESEPFEPVIKKTETHPDGAIFARGATDDKGQMFIHVKAVECMIKTGNLPCNVKFMIEGEEEIGSGNLLPFIQEHAEMLASDVILISDTSLLGNDAPSITVGLRGMSYNDVKVTAADKDMHSGTYGAGVPNPINILCDMVAALKDEKKHITIPGFYDDVVFPPDEVRDMIRNATFDAEEVKSGPGLRGLEGEEGYHFYERTGILPSLDCNGIWGGYTEAGSKTIIPAVANAKISMRLVSNQNHHKATQQFTDYFKSLAPDTVEVEVHPHHGGNPYVTPTDTIEFRAASAAMETTFGKKPVPMYGGGSIPIVYEFKHVLGVDIIMMGFGLDSDGLHSPNEHFGVWNFFKGIETVPVFFAEYAAMKSQA